MIQCQSLISQFQEQIQRWKQNYPTLQMYLNNIYSYPVANAFVFNNDLPNLDPDEIKFILVADNPGHEEQIQERYLIGKAGKTARNFFLQKLDIDFSKHVLVLNKTPIHTAKTSDLSAFPEAFSKVLKESQLYTARLTYDLQRIIGCPVFITGFSGCRTPDGVWLKKGKNGYPKAMSLPYYFEVIRSFCADNDFSENLFLFKHFSYGNFAKDFSANHKNGDDGLAILHSIGGQYRQEFIGRPHDTF